MDPPTSMRRRAYLDHNATSPIRPEARDAARAALDATAGNPSSLHAEGRSARARLETARDAVAGLAGALPRETVFTSGGSEALAAAVHGVTAGLAPEGRALVVSAVEHAAVLAAARAAARRGFKLEVIGCDAHGVVDAEAFEAALTDAVCLAALQWVNPETGVVQPLARVAAACAARGVPLLADAVQAAGKLRLDARPDFVAISGHKLGGPPGAGALVVRGDRPMAALIAGGGQEQRRRGGTEAVPAVAGLGAAAAAAGAAVDGEAARLSALRDGFETFLHATFPGVRVHGAGAARVANTTSFSLPGVRGETLAIALDLEGIAVSTGSACASGAVEPSHVLLAMGLDAAAARGAVRVSLGWNTTAAEVGALVEALPRLVERVRYTESA